MREARRFFVIAIASAAIVLLATATGTFAKDKAPKDKPPATGQSEKASHEPANACGCYRSAKGCVCTDKKGKCECPGECEPVGCDKRREQDLEKEMAAEVKRAQEDEKRRHDEQQAQERSAAADAGLTPDPAEAPAKAEPSPTKNAKGTKPARKDAPKGGAKADPATDGTAAK
jgi:hypothetical protein